ncbi:MAG TPA: penicillin-binding protein, partial [Allosphingosinicella sp.]|nr:penicillin-binding protein [Allosphingosinicella sp.]
GNDDNTPLPGTAGGGLPARIWHAFMVEALGDAARGGPAVPLREADRAPETNTSNAIEPTPAPGDTPPGPEGPQPPEVIAPPPPAPKEEPAPDA